MKKQDKLQNVVILMLAVAIVFAFLVIFILSPYSTGLLVNKKYTFHCDIREDVDLHPVERPTSSGNPCPYGGCLKNCGICSDTHTYLFDDPSKIIQMSFYVGLSCHDTQVVDLHFLIDGSWVLQYHLDLYPTAGKNFNLNFEPTEIEGFRFSYHWCCLRSYGDVLVDRAEGDPGTDPEVDFPWFWLLIILAVAIAVITTVAVAAILYITKNRKRRKK